MHGTITFPDIESLAEFLKHFTGSTATFKSYQYNGKWVIEFLGGY